MDEQEVTSRWEAALKLFCPRCIMRHLSFSWSIIVKPEYEIMQYLESQYDDFSGKIGDNAEKNLEGTLPDDCIPCRACLGVLQMPFMSSCVQEVGAAVQSDQYTFASFQPQFYLPVQLHVFHRYSIQYFRSNFGDENVDKDPHEVKEILKIILEPMLCEILGSERKQDAPLEISVHISHEGTKHSVLPVIETKMKKRSLNYRAWKRVKPNDPVFTIAAVKSALMAINDVDLENICSHVEKLCIVEKVMLFHTQVYVGGRYNKYSRELPQTPWFIDGERKIESSVQEYIGKPIQTAFVADSYNFSSSGREDVDVRMLGNGRPFLIELINARHSKMTPKELELIQQQINDQTKEIQIRDLQVVSKSDCKRLKEGEEEKTKSYAALCCFIHPPTEEELGKLSKICDLSNIVLQQKTPIRVLHRRPLATRSRVIHSVNGEVCENEDSRLFKLFLRTQAGTYVKEFVHGDFGRTSPSLGELLGAEVDIIDLDVESVDVNWPPVSKR